MQRLISRVDNNDNPSNLVVTLQDADNQNFIRLVKERGSTLETHGNDLLNEAAKNLTESVKDHIKDKSNRKERLLSLCDYVQDRINFLPLELQSESDGYLVFDTTNTRGMRLSASEGLKARLVTIAARQDTILSEELIRIWDGVASKLESAELSIDAMDAYMHAILSAREGSKVKRNLDLGRDKLTETDEIRDLLEDIEIYCGSYLAVLKPSGESLLTEDLKDLRRLNVRQADSFMTMVHKHSFGRLKEAVNLVLSLQIRNITVGQEQANRYEKDWPAWSNMVRKGETEKAFQGIRGQMVSDDDFQKSFEIATVSAAGAARHLLRRLDTISQSGSGVHPMEVDVEHVLPKSVVNKLKENKDLTPRTRQWIEDLGYEVPGDSDAEVKRVLGEKIEQMLNMLGNQALLDSKKNRGAKDKSFSKKKIFYSAQALKMTKSLKNYKAWKRDHILARQKEMAKKAPKIWPK